jgi:hypothetical protein
MPEIDAEIPVAFRDPPKTPTAPDPGPDAFLVGRLFRNAAITIADVELMHRFRKGQFGLRRLGVESRAVPAIRSAVLGT